MADKDDEKVNERFVQVEISRKLTSPTISHPNKVTKREKADPEFTVNQTDRRKIQRRSQNLSEFLSNSR